MDVHTVKKKCEDKWVSEFEVDDRAKNALDRFEIWISKIPNNYKELSLTLIQNLEYYSRKLTNRLLMELHKKLLEHQNIKEDNTIYTYIKSKDGKTNSSNDYWTEYKLFNEINKQVCYENVNAIMGKDLWECVENIVFIDDFSGTGKSFIKELEKNEEFYYNKNIYFITICIMEEAIQKIINYSQEKNIKTHPIYSYMQKKTFEQELFEDNIEAKENLFRLTHDLGIPKKESPLGFGESESLVAFYNNTPNNTLPIIRYDTEKYTSLFPRNREKDPLVNRLNKMRLQCKGRKIANYNNKSV